MKTKLKAPKIPYEGWTIEEDNEMKSVDLSKLVLHLEPEQEKGYIEGNELRKRLKDKQPLSASVLDYLIEHLEQTPKSWRKKNKDGDTQFIYFFGTIYRDRGGDLCVRCLFWDDGRWHWGGYWLGGDFDGDDPAALPASSTLNSEPKTSLDSLNLEARVQKLEEWQKRVMGIVE